MSMNDKIRIPDDVWTERCQWCVHRQTSENRTVEKWECYSSRLDIDRSKPCRIMSIARFADIPGECKSFAPHNIYGLCMTCKHDSIFQQDRDYCKIDERPNYRQIYIGIGYQEKAYWGIHRLSTCDNYEPSEVHIEGMREDAARGKIPRNFDPETMKPIGEAQQNETAEKWAAIENELAAEDRRTKAAREAAMAERDGQIPGQVSIADLI